MVIKMYGLCRQLRAKSLPMRPESASGVWGYSMYSASMAAKMFSTETEHPDSPATVKAAIPIPKTNFTVFFITFVTLIN